ncbi:MAG: hypothetical protein U5L09_13795 [Bacteroidales bacterium]|nr:hypothetical protein [Bacteroidales bacterium]
MMFLEPLRYSPVGVGSSNTGKTSEKTDWKMKKIEKQKTKKIFHFLFFLPFLLVLKYKILTTLNMLETFANDSLQISSGSKAKQLLTNKLVFSIFKNAN